MKTLIPLNPHCKHTYTMLAFQKHKTCSIDYLGINGWVWMPFFFTWDLHKYITYILFVQSFYVVASGLFGQHSICWDHSGFVPKTNIIDSIRRVLNIKHLFQWVKQVKDGLGKKMYSWQGWRGKKGEMMDDKWGSSLEHLWKHSHSVWWEPGEN